MEKHPETVPGMPRAYSERLMRRYVPGACKPPPISEIRIWYAERGDGGAVRADFATGG